MKCLADQRGIRFSAARTVVLPHPTPGTAVNLSKSSDRMPGQSRPRHVPNRFGTGLLLRGG
jgi:hypothetical protein